MKKYTFFFAASVMALGLTVTSCKKDETSASTASQGFSALSADPLYTRLGGETMVDDPANPGNQIEQGRLTLRSVVDSTIFVIADDGPFLNKFFPVLVMELGNGNTTGLEALSKSLTDFFCAATGSANFSYQGLNMVDAHDPATNNRMGEKSADADFDKFVGFVVEGAGQNGVPATSPIVAEIGALLETLRGDVVQK